MGHPDRKEDQGDGEKSGDGPICQGKNIYNRKADQGTKRAGRHGNAPDIAAGCQKHNGAWFQNHGLCLIVAMEFVKQNSSPIKPSPRLVLFDIGT
jgi:hypothetical protein